MYINITFADTQIMELRLFNSLGKTKEVFRPKNGNLVTVYCCGPTVYDYTHIGNLRTFLFEDILTRYLEYKGYEVKFVMNITDVDDKTISSSRKYNTTLKDYTKKFTDEFFKDLKSLNIREASLYPRATEYIQDIENHIIKLQNEDYCYESEGSYYFSINKFAGYGRLSGLEINESRNKTRLNEDEYTKDNAQDFALWKSWDNDDGDVYWEGKLGKGRPGWHIECSVMSTKILGNEIDIHAGGVDLIFPHHENEIAQTEAVTKKQFVRYWIHAEHLIVEGKKMSKSESNFFTLRDLLDKGYDANHIRFLLIASHYRSQLNFTFDGIKQAKENIDRIQESYSKVKSLETETGCNSILSKITKESIDSFEDAMDNDLDMPVALASIFRFVRDLNKYLDDNEVLEENKSEILDYFKKINSILGILSNETIKLDEEIKQLIRERDEAREKKDWNKSDKIRDELLKRGYVVEDTEKGTRIKRNQE
ncbi:MAG TPA: cysteine--tRNA ligase [Nitrososphaerales archaeon]|nr:cysteine--tRNA ligase [Nitrososphaerales archaeon]